MSTENSLMKLDGRLVPSMFKGKEASSGSTGGAVGGTGTGGGATAGPKLGYRSMVSVDDVPELFASLDSESSLLFFWSIGEINQLIQLVL